jgi:tRNA dimethylallyltransferase
MVICLDTAVSELAPRLEARIAAMLEAGALDEARRALEQCPDTTAPGWSSIGCAELAAHLKGETTLDEAVELWLRNTKAYAKRQMTWFRKEKAARWVDSGDVEAMAALVRRFLDDPGDRP